MNNVIRMSFKQVYDLVFRARNAKLNSTAYVLEYRSWVKAGIAFNTRGFQLSTRKISYFARLYEVVEKAKLEGPKILQDNRPLLEQSLLYYYEDIYDIYQDHLRSKHLEAVQRRNHSLPDFGEVLILPCFDDTPELGQIFDVESFFWNQYDCKNREEFVEDLPTVYLDPESSLFKCASLMYDYGKRCVSRGVLLEVKLWDSQV